MINYSEYYVLGNMLILSKQKLSMTSSKQHVFILWYRTNRNHRSQNLCNLITILPFMVYEHSCCGQVIKRPSGSQREVVFVVISHEANLRVLVVALLVDCSCAGLCRWHGGAQFPSLAPSFSMSNFSNQMLCSSADGVLDDFILSLLLLWCMREKWIC